jgi:hypothetical protein
MTIKQNIMKQIFVAYMHAVNSVIQRLNRICWRLIWYYYSLYPVLVSSLAKSLPIIIGICRCRVIFQRKQTCFVQRINFAIIRF